MLASLLEYVEADSHFVGNLNLDLLLSILVSFFISLFKNINHTLQVQWSGSRLFSLFVYLNLGHMIIVSTQTFATTG